MTFDFLSKTSGHSQRETHVVLLKSAWNENSPYLFLKLILLQTINLWTSQLNLPVKHQTSLWWHMQDFSHHLVCLNPIPPQLTASLHWFLSVKPSQYPINNQSVEPCPHPTFVLFQQSSTVYVTIHLSQLLFHWDFVNYIRKKILKFPVIKN